MTKEIVEAVILLLVWACGIISGFHIGKSRHR